MGRGGKEGEGELCPPPTAALPGRSVSPHHARDTEP